MTDAHENPHRVEGRVSRLETSLVRIETYLDPERGALPQTLAAIDRSQAGFHRTLFGEDGRSGAINDIETLKKDVDDEKERRKEHNKKRDRLMWFLTATGLVAVWDFIKTHVWGGGG